MTAEIRADIILASEHIAAPPDVVFPYFTDPALMVQWIGRKADLDARPGGGFLLDMVDVVARGNYLVVEPPYRLVFSWGIDGSDELPPGTSIVEVVLTPDGDDTMVVLTHRDLPASQLDDHRAGWQHQLGRLVTAAG